MKSLFFLLALLCAFSSVGQTRKHFRKAYQTVYGNYVGVYPLEEKDTLETNHLTFIYDENNKLKFVESRKALSGELIFSDFINSLMIGFEYSDTSFTILNYFIDWDGAIVSSSNTTEYIMDSQGRTISALEHAFEEELGNEYIGTISYEYNNGKLVALVPSGEFLYNERYSSSDRLEIKLNKLNLIAEEIVHPNIEDQYDGPLLVKFRYVYEYDEFGNFSWMKSYDGENELILSYDNSAYTKYSYDKNGYLIKTVLLDKNDKRINYTSREYMDDGTFVDYVFPCETSMVYDKFGNQLSEKYFLSDGLPVENSAGVHEIDTKYDVNSGTVTTYYYTKNRQLVDYGSGYAGKSIQYDKKGRIIKELYIDVEGNLIQNEDGSVIVRATYNDEEMSKTITLFNAQDQPMVDNSGAHKYVTVTDEYGYDVMTVYGIEDDLLGYEQEYNYYVRTMYDADDISLVSVSYYNYAKNPVTTSEGYFRKQMIYDENGVLERMDYLDENLNLVNATFGDVSYAQVRYKFNDNLYILESAYYDAEGNRTIDENMISIYPTSYNSNDMVAQIDRYAADETLLNQTVSYATVKYIYDKEGFVIDESYYNNKGERWSNEQGIASYLSEYKNGLLVKSKWMNADFKPVTNSEGVYQIQNLYNADGMMTESIFLNKKGKKMNAPDGVCRVVYSYASKYDVSVIELFDRKGKHASGDPLGLGLEYSKIVYQYDEDGVYSDTIYYDINGEQTYYDEY
jgi:YD repeat-containing protein